MKKNKTTIIIGITLIIFLIVGAIYVSYGYVTSDIKSENGKGKYYVVESLRIEYSDGTETLMSKESGVFIPGSTLTKTFNVKNTGKEKVSYNILLTDIINTFNRKQDIVYSLYLDEILLSTSTFPNDEISYIVGDINNDNNIDILDYNLIKDFFENRITLTRLQMISADLNSDGIIDNSDSPDILKQYINNESNNTDIGKKTTTKNIETILYKQELEPNESITYKLNIDYLNSVDNQIEDSGKSINAKISFEQSN